MYSKNTSSLVHYINSVSCFDLLIEHMYGNNIVRFSDQTQGKYFTVKSMVLNDYRPFVSGKYENKQIENINLCIHTDLSFMKKEDIFLIQNRLKMFNIINFHPNNKNIFETTIIPAVPKIKSDIKNKRNNRILIIDQGYKSHLSNILEKTTIDLIDFEIYKDYYTLINKLSEYPLVVYTNHIDGLVSASAGCSIVDSSSVIKNKKILQSDVITNQKINYDFDTFSKILTKALK